MPDESEPEVDPLFIDKWSRVLADPDIRESGGEHGNEGVDYPRYWAVSVLIERELAGDADYALLFEYLQDVAVLNSACDPTSAVLYQVKKKDPGKWTAANLCKREETDTNAPEAPVSKKSKKKKLKAASPVGKLYLCVDRLSTHVSVSGVFLSNAPISLRLANGDSIPLYSKTWLAQLIKEDFEYIQKKIASELGVKSPLALCASLLFEQTKITPGSMRETVCGLVANYLAQQFPTMANVSGQIVERLVNAFSKRSGPKPLMCNLAEIVQNKGFTRANFTDIIKDASTTAPFATRLDNIIDCLINEGFPSRSARRISQCATRIQTDIVRDPATKEAVHWAQAVVAAQETDPDGDYKFAVTHIVAQLRKTFRNTGVHNPTDADLHSIAILAVIHAEEEPTPSSTEHKD
jgi:hypothetical protein